MIRIDRFLYKPQDVKGINKLSVDEIKELEKIKTNEKKV
jgi:hypothetical protein